MKKYITLIALLVCSQALAADRATIVDRNGNELGTSGNPIKVSLAGGGGGNSFETINASSGTDPVADSSTDTLNLTAGSGITITGDSSTDTVTIASTGASNWTDSGTYLKPNTAGDEMQVFGSGGAAFLNIGMATNQPEITYNWPDNSTTLVFYNTQYADSKIKVGNGANDYLLFGSDSDVPFIAAPGTGYSTGIGFYGDAVLPINHTGGLGLGGLSYSNNGESLGSSSYRWSNVYSVLGNFSGNLTLGTSGSDESITITDDNATAGITWSEAGNQMLFIAPSTQDATGYTTGNYVFQASSLNSQTASRVFFRDNTAGRGFQIIANNADASIGIMHPSGGGALYFPGATASIYPASAATAATADPTANNNVTSFGGSSNRWSNIYSVLGNFSGATTFTGDSAHGGTVTSSATGSIGWSVVAAANQACTTTCTSAAVVGFDTNIANPQIVDTASALADQCLCAGSS